MRIAVDCTQTIIMLQAMMLVPSFLVRPAGRCAFLGIRRRSVAAWVTPPSSAAASARTIPTTTAAATLLRITPSGTAATTTAYGNDPTTTPQWPHRRRPFSGSSSSSSSNGDAVHGDGQADAITTGNETQPKSSTRLKFEDTPLGRNGAHLLDGLDVYSVAADDGHPIAVYGINSQSPILDDNNNHDIDDKLTTTTTTTTLKPILLLHGRTWSSVPVFHLLGGSHGTVTTTAAAAADTNHHHTHHHESRSLMEALLAKGLQPYCMDFRGFGGTPPDETGCVEPYRCVQDAETVLRWISQRHNLTAAQNPPALLGWSQGALVAQMAAQKSHPALSKVILYGSIYDPLIRYPREPLYSSHRPNRTVIYNQFDNAMEDFTVEGTIAPEPARLFAEAALLSDPVRAVWKNLYQFNNCDPARVHVPCLVVAGDQDPYAPLHVQQELFGNLARASDRTWCILSGADHACHLLDDGRFRLINTVVSFVHNGKRTEQKHDVY